MLKPKAIARPFKINCAVGFTLIELMVTVTLLLVLVLITMPEMRTYTVNSKIRRTAEAFTADLMEARAEAVRINQPVIFTLTATPNPFDHTDPDTLVADGKGPNWATHVVTVADGGNWENPRLLRAMDSEKLGKAISIKLAKGNIAGKKRLVFNGFGVVANSEKISGNYLGFQFTSEEYNPGCALDNPIRCLQVEISPSGSARICEPGRTDERSCRV